MDPMKYPEWTSFPPLVNFVPHPSNKGCHINIQPFLLPHPTPHQEKPVELLPVHPNSHKSYNPEELRRQKRVEHLQQAQEKKRLAAHNKKEARRKKQ